MSVIESIYTRRSIRKYTSEEINDSDIEIMLKSAMSAPSARNTQPWNFIIITDRKVLNAIPKFHPYAEMITKAPMAIAVCGDQKLESNREYLAVDCSAATENLLLAAHALGLGAVWLGVYPRKERMEKLGELLELPPNIVAISLIVVGHPAEEVSPVNRFKPNRIHKNKW